MKWYWWLFGGTVIAAIINRERVMNQFKNRKLSPNFSLAEFVTTSTGLENVPGEKEIKNLEMLVIYILQPLRTHLGRPITINSGYRSPLVNQAIGGSDSSQHMTGQAADIHIDGLTNQQIIDAIRLLKLPYDQVIDEQLRGKQWVHVSYDPTRGRRQWLTARDGSNGKTVYNTVMIG